MDEDRKIYAASGKRVKQMAAGGSSIRKIGPVLAGRAHCMGREPKLRLNRILMTDALDVRYDVRPSLQFQHEKALRETQTLRAGCSQAEPKNFAPPQTPFRGRRTAKMEMVTTCTYRPSLVKIDARNFELSW